MRPARLAALLALVLAACGGTPAGNPGGDGTGGSGGNGATCGNGTVEAGEACDAGAANSDTVADACRTDCTAARCGDGVVDAGESCDEGDRNSDTGPGACRRTCVPASCGDGVLDPEEGCDDGTRNGTAGSSCRGDCVPKRCGDGVRDAGEACDDGAANSDTEPGACRTNCRAAGCGDGVRDPGEACDDGRENSDSRADACRTTCVLARCGDRAVDTGEECDAGPGNSDTAPDACRTTCVRPACGDGVKDTAEGCDDGAANDDAVPDACRTSCVRAGCGDGVRDAAEACDNGGDNSDVRPDACRTTCALPSCGDGVADAGEACDEGAANSDVLPDACRTACVPPACGDGVRDTGEGCDAGGANDDTAPDACRTGCTPAGCGDRVVDTGETCDLGAENSDTRVDGCRTTCRLAGCGDGVVDTGEACDAGIGNSDTVANACRATCVGPACGDAVVDAGEACDAGSRNSDTAPGACRLACTLPRCGDRVVDPGETCDDGNAEPFDGCSATCSVEPWVCGDQHVGGAEQCDDGNTASGDGCSGTCRWEISATCGALPAPVVNLQVAGTPAGPNAIEYAGTTVGARSAASSTCGGNGPETFHGFVPPVAGDLVVEVERTGSGGAWNPVVAVRRDCDDPVAQLACAPVGGGVPADRRVVVRDVTPRDGPYFVQVDGADGTSGPYLLRVRVVGSLAAGASCFVDGRTGRCDPATLACADPDADGAGTCVPAVPAGGTCDPAGATSRCVAGLSCPAGTCVAVCGDGQVGGAEGCDDGNTVSGDNCDSLCREEGRACAEPVQLNRWWDPVAHAAAWRGHTDRFVTTNFSLPSACGSTAVQKDGVATFTAPRTGRYLVTLQPDGWNAVLAVDRDACTAAPAADTGFHCSNASGNAPESVIEDLAAGQSVVIYVDGNGTSLQQGPFTLEVREAYCGNGRVDGYWEQCDDGNTDALDRCSPTCEVEDYTCTQPAELVWDATAARAVWSGDTAFWSNHETGTCSVSPNLDGVARFVAPATGHYSFQFAPVGAATWDATVYVRRGACAGGSAQELSCANALGAELPETAVADLVAGETVYVVAEPSWEGPFELRAVRQVCGDGLLSAPELCDDGNTVPWDGCNASCVPEPAPAPEPNNTQAAATAATVGFTYTGTLPAGDVDVYRFTAVAGTSYTFETWVGAMGDCRPSYARDTRLRLTDGTGALLAADDDSGLGYAWACSKLTWTAPAPGAYYLTVAPASSSIGTYFVQLRSP